MCAAVSPWPPPGAAVVSLCTPQAHEVRTAVGSIDGGAGCVTVQPLRVGTDKSGGGVVHWVIPSSLVLAEWRYVVWSHVPPSLEHDSADRF